MGGTSRSYLRDSDLSKLQEIAREELRSGTSDSPHAFLSFASEDLDKVSALRAQAKNDGLDFEFDDWSLREPFDSTRAEYIRSGIRDRIRHSSVVVVVLSNATAQSKWVNWEVEEALRQGKRILSVFSGGQEPRQKPSAITDNGVPVRPWTVENLSKFLKGDDI